MCGWKPCLPTILSVTRIKVTLSMIDLYTITDNIQYCRNTCVFLNIWYNNRLWCVWSPLFHVSKCMSWGRRGVAIRGAKPPDKLVLYLIVYHSAYSAYLVNVKGSRWKKNLFFNGHPPIFSHLGFKEFFLPFLVLSKNTLKIMIEN